MKSSVYNNMNFPLIIFHLLSSLTFAAYSSYTTNNVLSKDVQIHPNLNISARLYLPEPAARKLPLLVYFHGGAFVAESPFSPTYHNHVKTLVEEANVAAVSVNYRLAPEYPLPVAYHDSWLALEWVFSHFKGNGTDEWLKNDVDFERVYLGGDSSGANIAHYVAVRVGSEDPTHGMKVHGMFLNCPYFWGNDPVGNEVIYPQRDVRAKNIWIRAYPDSAGGFDDPLLNPARDPNLWKLGCRKVVVYVTEKDIFRDRGYYYAHVLMKSHWDGVVEVVEVKGKSHIFNLRFPEDSKAKIMVNQLALFLNDEEELLQCRACGDNYLPYM